MQAMLDQAQASHLWLSLSANEQQLNQMEHNELVNKSNTKIVIQEWFPKLFPEIAALDDED